MCVEVECTMSGITGRVKLLYLLVHDMSLFNEELSNFYSINTDLKGHTISTISNP